MLTATPRFAQIAVLAFAAALAAASSFADERDVRLARSRGLRPGELESRQRYGGGGFVPRRYTMEDFNRWAKQAAIRRLTSSQLDPETGLLAWPRVLMSREFSDLRRDLDRLFRQRAEVGGAIDNDAYFGILDRVEQMNARLMATVGDVRGISRTRGYLRARVFLRGLSIEPEYGTGTTQDVNLAD